MMGGGIGNACMLWTILGTILGRTELNLGLAGWLCWLAGFTLADCWLMLLSALGCWCCSRLDSAGRPTDRPTDVNECAAAGERTKTDHFWAVLFERDLGGEE